jgi:siroheme synthase (precorrin-2 oxidase/ferrochelatase)
MDHLPIFINVRQNPCLVIGGGDIALRKINLLIKAQAKVDCLYFAKELLICLKVEMSISFKNVLSQMTSKIMQSLLLQQMTHQLTH